MKVIFLKDVPKVGRKYDVKEVADGYAMNSLIPRKLVEIATPKSIAELEKRKKNIQIEKEIQSDLLMKNLEEIKGKVLHIEVKADDKGHLFKGVNVADIVAAMKAEHHADISPQFILLEKPIKEVGEYDIQIEIQGKKSSFKLEILAK